MARGSLPWLILAAVLSTMFAFFLESALWAPLLHEILGTSAWQNSTNTYAADGKMMIADFAKNLLTVITLGIWIGVIIDARRSL